MLDKCQAYRENSLGAGVSKVDYNSNVLWLTV